MIDHRDGLADAKDRQRAQSVFDRPVAVVAGAGTGKTTVLVARILGWCLGSGWIAVRSDLFEESDREPDREAIAAHVLDGLVAITFTEAAAAQMARRVAEALASIARNPAAPVTGFDPGLLPVEARPLVGERARALIAVLDRLAIRTIHAHCLTLLSSYPMAAGLALDLEVDADGRQLDEIVHEVVEEAIKTAYPAAAETPLVELALAGVDPRRLAEALHLTATEGIDPAAFEGNPFDPARLEKLHDRLRKAVDTVLRTAAPIGDQKRSPTDSEVVDALATMKTALTEDVASSLDDPARWLDRLEEIWSEKALARLGNWSRGAYTKTVEEILDARRHVLSRQAADLVRLLRLCRRIDVELLDAARRALGPLLRSVYGELRRRGLLTFNSLMSEALRLLVEQPKVCRRERRRLRQLLVDEFQDTDHLQCELIRRLALGGERDQRPGLFVVGDPKQSIYGWRDAELEAYEGFLDDLRAAGGEVLELTQNFRSVPAVLSEVDRAIEPVMAHEAGVQPEFASLVAHSRLAADPGFQLAERAPIEYWVSWTGNETSTRAEEAASVEAQAIAADIHELHEDHAVAWSEFGLLLRSTSRLESYLEAFRRFQVPFVVTSDKHYFRRREIIDAAALIRTIVLPVDHLALVAFLRSPGVGIPDVALLPLWRRQFPDLVTRLGSSRGQEMEALRTVLAEVATELPADVPGLDRIQGWHLSAVAALENLEHLRRAFHEQPADRFLRQVRERCLFDVTESARHLGIYRLANLDRFFRELETALEDRAGDAQAVLRTLSRSVAQAEEAEQALPEGAVDEAVQVMTIHGAKGLEFGHVYLPQLHAEGGRELTVEVGVDRRWTPDQPPRYALFGCPTPGWEEVEERVARTARAEQVRTLYVAMTRARRRLVLIGNWPRTVTPVVPEKRRSYVHLLSHRLDLPPSITELSQQVAETETAWIDAGRARWRFPGLMRDSARSRVGRSTIAGFPTRRQLQRDEKVLDKARSAAERRMAQPWAASASSEAAARLALLAPEDSLQLEPSFRDTGLRVGEAFHRLLEDWNLGATDGDAELRRLQARHRQWLVGRSTGEALASTLSRFDELIERFRNGQFFERFLSITALRPARELPVLLPPGDDDGKPVGYVSGFVDLLYRDPRNNRWTVVDYKTDRVEGPEVDQRASAYALQEAVYARAVQEALQLPHSPATQLWFIWPDRLWEDPG